MGKSFEDYSHLEKSLIIKFIWACNHFQLLKAIRKDSTSETK